MLARARGRQSTSTGLIVPAGALDRWYGYATPTASAAARREVVVIGDSTSYGSGGNYSWLQRVRDRAVGAGLGDGGKGLFAGGESGITYDAPEVNGFVSGTFNGTTDAYDVLAGQFYADSTAGHVLNFAFTGTSFRLWYGFRGNVGEFTYSVDGGAAVTIDALNTVGTTVKFLYVSGLTAGSHTVQVTNRGGRTAVPPAAVTVSQGSPSTGTFAAGTYYYKATYVFGGGETIASPSASVVDSGGSRSHALQIAKIGQDSTNFYRSTSSSGPWELVPGLTIQSQSGTVANYTDPGTAVSAGVVPPTTGTTNLNTSVTGCTIALAPMYDTGVSMQKYATSGGTMSLFMNDANISMYWQDFGLTAPAPGADRTDPASYTIDTSIGASGRVKPVLAILDLGFNDLSSATSNSQIAAVMATGVRNFAAACKAAGCDGLVLSGQLPYNSMWTTYGPAAFTALRDTALSLGLAFGDAFYPVAGPALAYAGGSSNPHLSKAQYQTQADWLFDNLLCQQIPPTAPANTVAPAITLANTVTSTPGTFPGYPTPTLTYQWKRAGTPISGATSSTYALQSADAGQAITLTVTATNTGGTASATSNTVTPAAPANTVAPALSGTGVSGATETCSTGTWTGSPTPTLTYQWKRAGTPISGATSSTYVIQTPDIGASLTCTVTGTNGVGAASVTTSGITPTAPPPATPDTIAGLAAWFKADALALTDGDPVATWADSSTNARDATQATSGLRPIYKTAIVNSKPIVRFDGVDDCLGLTMPTFTAATGFVVVKVALDPPTADGKTGLWHMGNNGGADNTHFPFSDGVIYDSFGSTTRKTTVNPTPALTSFHVYSVVSAPGAWSSWLDGSPLFTTATNTVLSSGAGALIGKSAGAYQLNGDIAEVVLYSAALSSTDRQSVEAYLKNKYATP